MHITFSVTETNEKWQLYQNVNRCFLYLKKGVRDMNTFLAIETVTGLDNLQ
jgi:hypothetical protein